MTRLAAGDALMYWMRERLPNDQFLLYCFDGPGHPAIHAEAMDRASRVADLRLKVRDVPWHLDYPVWVHKYIEDVDVVVRPGGGWTDCRDEIAGLLGTVLDPRRSPWRLHIFTGVTGIPGSSEPALVVVLQLSHALADGRGAARIARTMFGDAATRAPTVATPSTIALLAAGAVRTPLLVARMLGRSVRAARAYRAELALVENGRLVSKNTGYELVSLNRADDRHAVRILVFPVDALRGSGITVTVAALTAIGEALRRYLGVGGLGAEVTVARDVVASHRNNFHNVSVDLHVDEADLVIRSRAIRASLECRRARADHPSVVAQRLATQVTPAPLLRHSVRIADLTTTPARVAGNTVVTSVNRGPADLEFGGRVRFTAGFPALSPVMGVTHGVYAVGTTLSISIHASLAALPDPDRYAEILRSVVADVRRALASGPGTA